MEQIEERVY
jgi:hypothetical protein